MAKNRIEHSCEKNRGITAEEIRASIAETKRRKSQPGYAAAESRRLREIKSKLPPARFPELAKRGTKPSLVGMSAAEARTQHAKNILARVEKNKPQI